MSSSESTQINYSMKELLIAKAPRIDASMLVAAQGEVDGIDYLRLKRPFDLTEQICIPSELPSDDEIERVVLRALADAELELKNLGNVGNLYFHYSFFIFH